MIRGDSDVRRAVLEHFRHRAEHARHRAVRRIGFLKRRNP